MATFHVSIVTPLGEIFSGETESLMAPAEGGALGVMKDHAPLVAALLPGALTLRSGEVLSHYAVGQGIIEVAANRALVLVDRAELTADTKEASAKARTFATDAS